MGSPNLGDEREEQEGEGAEDEEVTEQEGVFAQHPRTIRQPHPLRIVNSLRTLSLWHSDTLSLDGGIKLRIHDPGRFESAWISGDEGHGLTCRNSNRPTLPQGTS